jgi:hypothetical protein
LSIIADISDAYISDAYIHIFNTCIRQAINRMKRLSKVSDSQWEDERQSFDEWCQGAIDDNYKISRDTSEHMGATKKKRIKLLKREAIDAEKVAADYSDE